MARVECSGPVIEREAWYSYESLKEIGLGRHSLRNLRRRGLPVSQLGRRRFVRGEDLIHFMSPIKEACTNE